MYIECSGHILGEESDQDMYSESGEPLYLEQGGCLIRGKKMPILNIQLSSTGLSGVKPQWDYIQTNDTVAEVLTTGYLNHAVENGFAVNQGDLAAVTTQASPTARVRCAIYQVDHNSTNWSLVPLESSPLLVMAQYTTLGGAAAEAITITGVKSTDLAFVQVVDNGTANVTVLQAACTTNTLTVTFSGNPGTDCIINYQIMRP